MQLSRQEIEGIARQSQYFERLNWPVEVIFDVGANVGQSAAAYLQFFPAAQVHCFEPNGKLLNDLRRRFQNLPSVFINHVALSRLPGIARLNVCSDPGTSSLLVPEEQLVARNTSGAYRVNPIEIVQVETLDEYCEKHGLARISILKTDTQGHDLDVLRGGERLLSESRVDLIASEVLFQKAYQGQCFFWEMASYLQSKKYHFLECTQVVPTSDGR